MPTILVPLLPTLNYHRHCYSRLVKYPHLSYRYPVTRCLWSLHSCATKTSLASLHGNSISHQSNNKNPLFLQPSFFSQRCFSTQPKQENESIASAWNIANLVTLGRIAITPVTGYWILNGEYEMALVGLVYAAFSDWFDGFLARRFSLETVVGSYLDPVADKLLITTTTVCLASQGALPGWLVSLIVGRDIILVVGWMALTFKNNGDVSVQQAVQNMRKSALNPLCISKLNTTLQISLGFGGVLNASDWPVVGDQELYSLGLATALTTSLSGLSYGQRFWAQWHRR